MLMKYLFTAQYKDGTFLDQDQEDKSTLEVGRSQFYDVLQKEKDLVAFALHGEGHSYAVDLGDGHFELDGVSFQTYDMPVENRRLIFFRRHTHDMAIPEYTETGHSIEFHLGWQGNLSTGENVQRVIIIS